MRAEEGERRRFISVCDLFFLMGVYVAKGFLLLDNLVSRVGRYSHRGESPGKTADDTALLSKNDSLTFPTNECFGGTLPSWRTQPRLWLRLRALQ